MTPLTDDPNKPEQLKLFMSGTQWENYVTHSTDGPMAAVWPQKLAQARTEGTHHGAGLKQSIMTKGYEHDRNQPPTIVHELSPSGKKLRRTQSEGHHRIAGAAEAERETGQPVWIPTNYVDNTKRRRG